MAKDRQEVVSIKLTVEEWQDVSECITYCHKVLSTDIFADLQKLIIAATEEATDDNG